MAMKIFLSAVSGPFGECRRALASDLYAMGADVKVQENFQQHGYSLLEALRSTSTAAIASSPWWATPTVSSPRSRRGPRGGPGGRTPSGSISSPSASGSMVPRFRPGRSSSTSPTTNTWHSILRKIRPPSRRSCSGGSATRSAPAGSTGAVSVRRTSSGAGPARRLPDPRSRPPGHPPPLSVHREPVQGARALPR